MIEIFTAINFITAVFLVLYTIGILRAMNNINKFLLTQTKINDMIDRLFSHIIKGLKKHD